MRVALRPLVIVCLLGAVMPGRAPDHAQAPAVASRAPEPVFEPVQPELFSVAGGQPNAWADFDNDGDLDLFVGFRGQNNRLYRNDSGRFSDVAATLGVADAEDTRAAAWGDFDGDGHLDLYVGFSRRANTPNKLYRNLGSGKRFTDVATEAGVTVSGETRQPVFVDFDNDGDVDLFVAFRDAPNALLRNDGGRFTDVAAAMGVADERKTVGAVWFDADEDGDLDLYVANQDGTLNGLFRNDGARFTDVAAALGVDGSGQPRTGSNGVSVADFDNDGDLDLFVANYGPNFLFRQDGGRFTDVAAAMGVAGGEKATPSSWGDFDNDGRPDLYVSSYVDKPSEGRDYLYHNEGDRFTEVMPAVILEHPASHGVQWADFDGDGDLDLALADNNPPGRHYLYRNLLPADVARRSLQVQVVDAAGRHTRAGSEVRVYASGTRTVLGTRLVDTGSGYCSQSVLPVHIGLAHEGAVDVEVVAMTPTGRRIVRVPNVEPLTLAGRPLVVMVSAEPTADPPLRPLLVQHVGEGQRDARDRTGRHFELGGDRRTVLGGDARRAPTHQLRRAQRADHGELERGDMLGAVNHGTLRSARQRIRAPEVGHRAVCRALVRVATVQGGKTQESRSSEYTAFEARFTLVSLRVRSRGGENGSAARILTSVL